MKAPTSSSIRRFSLTCLASSALVSVLALAVPHHAEAAGFYIQEQSVSGLGSAFSGSTTNLNDPSTVYFNPAGMTNLEGIQAHLGAHLLVPSSKLTDTGSTFGGAPIGLALGSSGNGGNPYDPTPVPNGFATYAVNDRLSLGIGVTAPFGLANEYDDGWFGRFDSTKTELAIIDVQPTVAYKVLDNLSIGAGINIQHSDATLENALFAGAEGTQKLKGDDFGYGYTVGIQYAPTETTTLGLNYKSAVKHELDGRLTIEGSGLADEDSGATAKLHLPDIATFGIAQKLNDKWTVMGQATWFGWNNFDNITVVRDDGTTAGSIAQNYQTTWAFALGAEYEHSDRWTFRGGVQFDETPTTDEYRTSRTPDGDRTWASLGATYSLTPNIDLDMAATYIHIAKEQINVARNIPAAPAVVSANSEGDVGIFALGLTYKF